MAKKSTKDVEEVASEQVPVAAKTKSIITQKIYVGPNLLGLPTYTVVETGFTKHIKGFVEKCPEIGKLFVPIAEMAKAEKRAKEKGTLEHRHYQKVIAFKNAGRKGE